jgi:plastocyanin
MMKKFCLFCAALCLFTAIVTACGGADTTTEERETGTATMTGSPTTTAQATGTTEAAEAPAPAGAATITIADMSFGDPVTVPPGAQITIKNDDSAEHSVTSQTAGQFDVHVDGNQQGMLTAPAEPGEYAFYCIYHPSMKGTLIVK